MSNISTSPLHVVSFCCLSICVCSLASPSPHPELQAQLPILSFSRSSISFGDCSISRLQANGWNALFRPKSMILLTHLLKPFLLESFVSDSCTSCSLHTSNRSTNCSLDVTCDFLCWFGPLLSGWVIGGNDSPMCIDGVGDVTCLSRVGVVGRHL